MPALRLFRKNSVALTLWTVVAISAAADCSPALARPPRIQPEPNGLYKVESVDNLNEAMAYDARVYRCTIGNLRVDSPPNAQVEFGKMTLRVSRVLLGDETNEAVVQYVRTYPPAQFCDHSSIWDDPSFWKPGQELCVIVIPHSYDPTGPVIPGVESAVSRVYIASGPGATEPAGLEKVCQLEKLRRAPDKSDFFKSIERALSDKGDIVSGYACEAATTDGMAALPDHFIEVFYRDVLHPKAEAISQGTCSAMTRSLGRTMRNSHVPLKAQIAAAHALAMLLIDAPDPTIRFGISIDLGSAISPEFFSDPDSKNPYHGPGPLPFKAVDVLSAAELARLRPFVADLAQHAGLRADSKKIADWLNG
ncbi:MAG TPA: hypothetical protein VFE47_09255 [Tepidisphaeraceae bacterium]|jgi:hypothetical protein|nr:hypothetical protein [Tepidisphaeraceae bacterium]